MEVDSTVIGIIVIALLGPVLVFLTRYVLRGRTASASRLWFLSLCAYMVFYYLARGVFFDTRIEPLFFALLWPIAAILAFWFAERAGGRQSPIPLFRWMAYFLAGAVFAFVLDSAGAALGWYTYTPAVITATAITNPITGSQAPAIVWLMFGVLMAGVFFLADTVYGALKRRIGVSTTNYVLIGLALIMGWVVYLISDLVMRLMK